MLEPPRNDEEDRRNPRNSHANKEVSNQESSINYGKPRGDLKTTSSYTLDIGSQA